MEPNQVSQVQPLSTPPAKKNTGLIVVLIIVFLLIVVGLFYYFNSKNNNPSMNNSQNNITQNTTPAIPQQPEVNSETGNTTTSANNNISDPKGAYLVIKAEEDKMVTFDDLKAFTLKYTSAKQIAKFETNEKQIDALSSEQKQNIVDMMKSSSPSLSDITTIQENINGTTATLDVQTNKSGLSGVITLVKENNQWKLDNESWDQK